MRFRRWLRAVVPLLLWMGGYGALASAGAGYGKEGGSARAVPGGHFDAWAAGNAKFEARKRENLKAMVAIAP
jgi:hypothetical protein